MGKMRKILHVLVVCALLWGVGFTSTEARPFPDSEQSKIKNNISNPELNNQIPEQRIEGYLRVQERGPTQNLLDTTKIEHKMVLNSTGWITVTQETFEGSFPTGSWLVFDNDGPENGEYLWGIDDFFPKNGNGSAWPARNGVDGIDPESNDYPHNAQSWMVYGPVDLSNATDAEVLFNYTNISEIDFDYFGWYATNDWPNFYGTKVHGDSGGWIDWNFDLTDVYTLGDLTGSENVWIAFVFESDPSIADQGPFVDDIVFRMYYVNPAPEVSSILRVDSNPTNAESLQYAVNFTQDVIGVDVSDFVLTSTAGISGAGITGISGIDSTYTVTINSGTGDGTLRLDITDNDSIMNASAQPLGGAGIGNGDYSIGETYTIDRTPPYVSSILLLDANPVNAASVRFKATFSEAVSGVDLADFNLVLGGGVSGASLTGVSGSGETYTVTVSTGTGDGTIRLDVSDNDSIMDEAGNQLGGFGVGNGDYSSGEVYSIEKFPPNVTNIVRLNNSPTNAAVVSYEVTFSKNVTGVDISDFVLVTSGVSGATITDVSGSASSYVVVVGTGTGNGTLRLDVDDDDSILDDEENPLGGVGPDNGDFTGGEIYIIDRELSTWNSIGPFGGYLNCLVMAPSDPDVMVVGTDSGIFNSTNNGVLWAKTNFTDTKVLSVQVSPASINTIYAGTEDGVFKSEDGGNNWTPKGLKGARVNSLSIDPHNSTTIYAGTGWKREMSEDEVVGIFKSTDGGNNWVLKESAYLDAVVTLLIDTDDSSYVYAGVYTESSGPGFYKSTNYGDTWVSRQVGPYNWDEVTALAMTASGAAQRVIYAVGNDDVFTSTNRGESWLATNIPFISGSGPWAVAVDPNSPNTVYVSTHYFEGRMYKSSDAGSTWAVKANGLPPEPSSSIVIDPRDSQVFAALDSGGIYISNDSAENWVFSSQGLLNTSVTGLVVAPAYAGSSFAGLAASSTDSNTVFATIAGDGHFLVATDNGGVSWDHLSNVQPGLGSVEIDPQNPATIYAGKNFDKQYTTVSIYKSTDAGQNWSSGFLFYQSWDYVGVSDIWVNPVISNTILSAVSGFGDDGGGVYRSTDGGSFWLKVYSFWATSLAADPANPNTLYFGSARNGYVYQSLDGGINWSMISPGGTWVWEVRDIAVGSNSHIFVATSEGLRKWDGSTWSQQSGLPSEDITTIVIDLSTTPNTIYVGMDGEGVYVSNDGGNTWDSFNEDLNNLRITDLYLSSTGQKILYGGTEYGGVWSRMLSSSQYNVFIPLVVR